MNPPDETIVIFAYAFAHRKTQEFLYELAASGRRACVIGAPWKPLPFADKATYFPRNIRPPQPYPTDVLCRALGFEFHHIDHDDVATIGELVRRSDRKLAVIAGARILKRAIIDLFEDGVVNFHPGRLPETSGLDALFYSIKRNVPMGMTAHFIDHRVDAGRFLFFEELELGPNDGLDAVLENMHLIQITALRRFMTARAAGELSPTPIDRPSKNKPMPEEEKWQTLTHFSRWRAYHYLEQQKTRLFVACQNNQSEIASRVLDALPELISARTQNQWTPLIVACFYGAAGIVEMLLKRGADPDLGGRNGTTPLMYAKTRMMDGKATEADFKLLSLLADNGVDLYRTDAFGKTVHDYVDAAQYPALASRISALTVSRSAV